jgi:prophage DNA circulation protein
VYKRQNLARVVDHQLPYVVVPAVVLAYDLYGDPDRDQEIVDRNPTAHHPGFLPTAAPLEVLSA